MSLEQLISSPLVHQLGWTLIHSLWEGLAVALLVMAALHLPGGRTPQARYLIACGGLLGTLGLAVGTFCILHGPSTTTTAAPLAAATASPAAVHLADDVPQVPGDGPRMAPARVAAEAPVERAMRAPQLLGDALPWLVGVWTAGVIVMSLWYLGGWIAVQRLRILGTRTAGRAVETTLGRLKLRMG